MFSCPICDEWVMVHKLCSDCDKIRQLCKIYTKSRLLEVLDKTLVIQQMKTDAQRQGRRASADRKLEEEEK